MAPDYSQTAAGDPLISDERLQRVLDMLAVHLQQNEGPVGPFMEFVLQLVTIQLGIVIPDELQYGAAGDEDWERENAALGIASGIISEHLEAQRRGGIAAASTEIR
jgi:hypothetical protein